MHKVLLLERDLSLHVGFHEDLPLDDGQLRIAIAAAGVCGSDLHAIGTGHWVEYWPAVLGHEVSGVVTESTSPGFPVGTVVVLDSRLPCGECSGCAISPRFCLSLAWLGETRPGGYAESIVVPATQAYRVPDGLGADLAVLAEPLAVVLSALSYPRRTPRTIAVLGFGPIGALAAVEARRRWPQAALNVVEPEERRRGFASDMGLSCVAELEALPPGSTYDLVIDAAGYPRSVNDALRHAHTGAMIVLLALGNSRVEADAADLVEKGVEIVGSIGFDHTDLTEALSILAAEPDPLERCITHKVPLAEAPEFFAAKAHRQALKTVIVP